MRRASRAGCAACAPVLECVAMSRPDPDEATLDPLQAADFSLLAELAAGIWRTHYTPIIGAEQVEYMLRGRYTPERLAAYLGAGDRWLRVLRVKGEPAGYCSYALGPAEAEMKLQELYLHESRRGSGLGGFLLRHVEAEARRHGRHTLWLTVNRHNQGSIDFYRRAGFTVREEKRFDIGRGYVMDDYVMEKALGEPDAAR